MGAWGPHPKQNDTALDFCYTLTGRPITQVIEQGLNSSDYDEIRVAAWLLQQIYDVYPIDLRDEVEHIAHNKLSDILDDEEWIKTWKDQKAIGMSVAEQVVFFGAKLGKRYQREREAKESVNIKGSTDGVCEHCGAPCEYHSEVCLCPTCEMRAASDGDECPICRNGTVNVAFNLVTCCGECGVSLEIDEEPYMGHSPYPVTPPRNPNGW